MLKDSFGKKETDTPFFIFGCGRSGTSLLSRMLNQHSRLAVPYESHLFNTFSPLLKYYGDLNSLQNRKRLIDDILKTDVMNDWEPKLDANSILENLTDFSFAGVFDSIMNTWTIKNGKKRWGEKTPHHIYYWNEILKIWPEAKIIHIYRDGRDVALSLLNARFGPKTVYANAYYWNKYLDQVNKVKNVTNKNTFFEISYENLLDDAEETLEKTCQFLGEKFEPSMIEFYKNKADYKTDIQNMTNLKRPIIKNNKEKWRQKMSLTDLRLFETIARDYLIKYGYELENKSAEASNFDHFWYGKVISPLKKFLAMIKNTKGHKDSFIKLTIRAKLIIKNIFVPSPS